MASQLLMTSAVVVLLVKVTLLLTLSLVWAGALARASASTRHLLWLTSLSLLLALPLVSSTLPTLRVVPVPFDATEETWPNPAEQPLADAAPVDPAPEGEPVASLRADASPPPATGPAWTLDASTLLALLLGVWAAGSLLLLGRLALSALALRRALRRTTPLQRSEWTVPLCEAADRLDLVDIPRLVMSEDAAMPFACGFRKPTIVLPAAAREWDADRRRAVLFHELAHVRRRDLVGHTVARLVCAIYWMHPMVWTAARRLRAESERACDDLALSVGIRPSEYADHLLQIVTGVRGNRSPAVALPFADRRELEGRVLAILDPVLRRGRPSAANVGALAALLLAGIAFSALAPAVDAPAQGATEGAWTLPVEGGDASTALVALTNPADPADPGGPEEHAIDEPEDLRIQLEQELDFDAPAVEKHSVEIHVSREPSRADVSLLLSALANDPSPTVRRTAAWTLASVDATGATDALARALLKDADDGVRETAAWALGSDGDAAGMDALLEALAHDESERVRATAAWALGHGGYRASAALPALERALGDPAAPVRERAAWGVGTLEPETAPAALYRRLLDDPSVAVRRVTAWALSEIRDPRASDALLARLDRETDQDVVRAIARALLRTTPRSPAALERLLASPQEDVRARAIAAAAGASPLDPWPWPWPDPRPMP